MVTFAYTDTTGRNITQTAYNAQVGAGTDVSGYTALNATTPAITSPAATPAAPIAHTSPVVTSPAGITDEMKDTDVYRNLINDGWTEQELSDRFDSTTRTNPNPTQEQDPNLPIDQTTQGTTGEYSGLEGDPELITPQDTEGREVELYKGDPDYKDASEQRLMEISNNVKAYYNTNPNAFANYDEFKDFFSYGDRINEQKQVLDSFRRNKSITDMFGSMSASEIGNLYLGGSFSDSDLSNLGNIDPNRLIEIQSYINTANTYNDANTSVSGGKLDTVRRELGIEVKEYDLLAEYDEMVNTPEINALQDSVAASKLNIQQLDEKIFNMRDSVEAQYEGTGINADVLDAIVADKTEALNKEKRTATLTYNSQLEKYNGKMEQAKTRFGIFEDQIALDRQTWQDSMEQLGFYYDYTPQGMAEMASSQYNAENPDMNSEDSQVSRMALDQTLTGYYEDYRDIIQRPQDQVMADVMAYAQQNNVSVSQALQENFIKPLQGKKAYQALQAGDSGVTYGKIGENKDGDIYGWIDPLNRTVTPTIAPSSIETTDVIARGDRKAMFGSIVDVNTNAGYNAISQQIQGKFPNGTYGGRCGETANDYATAIYGKHIFGDYLDEKPVNSQEPQIGGFVVMDTNVNDDEGRPYGHVGIVTGINADGTLKITDSNWNGDKLITTHDDVKIGDSRIKGYYNDIEGIIGGSSSVVYDSNLSATYMSYLTQTPAQKRKAAEDAGKSVPQMEAEALSYKQDTNTRDFENIINKIDEMLESDLGKGGRISASTFLGKISGDEQSDFKSNFEEIYNTLGMKKFLELKAGGATFGALSDQERQAIYDAANGMRYWTSDEKFEKEMLRLKQQIILSAKGSLDNYYTSYTPRHQGTDNTELDITDF